ncbi:hypothetical protein L1987_10630 [Smallanthus sonchifolius]|uniref:Uncharacterized protein n=1 Tax=Smallanthus sonchifolius TaxID=185202 RepID=A0ACB9JSN3_9ASTR|nr:hypothetical protein L1987_10630 [Smallanthus sonchifolius]
MNVLLKIQVSTYTVIENDRKHASQDPSFNLEWTAKASSEGGIVVDEAKSGGWCNGAICIRLAPSLTVNSQNTLPVSNFPIPSAIQFLRFLSMAANLQTYRTHFHFLSSSSKTPKFPFSRNPNFIAPFPVKLRLSTSNTRSRDGFCSLCFASKSMEEIERPPFDINRAVILAGFAFEAYTTPAENVGKSEVDAAGCQTRIISESFLREIYDGQLFITLTKGYDFPAMDPWGTSDPYVVLQLDSQVVKSKVKWGTKEPTWNEELTLYIKHPPTNNLQVAAWDANLVAPHKRMGNSSVSLGSVCDGNSHEVLVELEGMGGGGKVQLEVKYKSFDTIEEEKNWWRLPFVAEFLRNNGFESALRKVIGSEPAQARQFVEYAFGQLKSINNAYIQHNEPSNEAGYVESGLATPSSKNTVKNDDETTENPTISNIQSSISDIKKATQDLLKQTDSILGALMVLNATVTELTKDGGLLTKNDTRDEENLPEGSFDKPVLDEKKAEEMRVLFSTAESAMEAWAMLATSLGHPSFIKSEFEKICFLDNPVTDTQVAIWLDSARNRLVVAFRGTEQVKWKDLRTDLMLVLAGLNPERIGGDFKEEVQVSP